MQSAQFVTNTTSIACATLCGKCRASSGSAVDGCDALRFIAAAIKEHHGELRTDLWAIGSSGKTKIKSGFTDVNAFRMLLQTAAYSRGVSFVDGVDHLEWRIVGMDRALVYRYAQLGVSNCVVLPEARRDFYDLLSLPARPQSRVDAARILARRTLTPGTGFDVWNSGTGMLTRVGGVRPFFPETNQ